MNETEILTILRLQSEHLPNPLETPIFLKALEKAMQATPIQNIQLFAPYLHHFFQYTNTGCRASILRICAELEMSTEEYITEKYDFDLILSMSIETKSNLLTSKIDEEKTAAFEYLSILIKVQRRVPISVQRALISLYQIQNTSFTTLILSYLCEIVIFCDTFIHEICNVFSDHLCSTPDQTVISTITYCIENHIPLLYSTRLLSPLVSPFTTTKSDGRQQNCRESLIMLLRTWPGFLFSTKLILDLVRLVPQDTESVLTIFRSLLHLNDPIYDGYTGFLLSLLMENDLITNIKKVTQKQVASSFLTDIIAFVDFPRPYLTPLSIQRSLKPFQPVKYSFIFDVAQHSSQIATLSNNNFNLTNPDHRTWNWDDLHLLLTVVLPNNSNEAQNQKAIFIKLLDFFSSDFLAPTSIRSPQQTSTLKALISLLLMNSWGVQIIESVPQFRSSLIAAISSLQGGNEKNSSQWPLFQILPFFYVNSNGLLLAEKWDLTEKLCAIGLNRTTPTLVDSILELIPTCSATMSIIFSFLSNSNIEIYKITLADIQKKCQKDYKALTLYLIPHIIQSRDSDRLHIALNTLSSLISQNEELLTIVARDHELCSIVRQNARQMYALFFNADDTFDQQTVDDEISWWMNEGIYIYPSLFDASQTNWPPHLFSHIKPSLLRSSIERLLVQMIDEESVFHLRGIYFALGQFASMKSAAKDVEDLNMVSRLIELKPQSYVLIGTIISSLSIFYRSEYVLRALSDHGWKVINFAKRGSVVPPPSFYEMKQEKVSYISHLTLFETDDPDIKKAADLLGKLANNITLKTARPDLTQMVHDRSAVFKNKKFCRYAHRLCSAQYFSNDVRNFIINSLFRGIAVMDLPDNLEEMGEKERAEASVMLDEVLKYSAESFGKIPVMSKEKICTERAASDFPEVYLSEQDFVKEFGVGRDAFYSLPAEKRKALRIYLIRGSE